MRGLAKKEDMHNLLLTEASDEDEFRLEGRSNDISDEPRPTRDL